jgi:aubergine
MQKKGFNSVMTKILLQMAAKVGNKLWVPRVSPRVPAAGVMMVGIENYGDQEDKGSNILAYCCNTNRECSSFYSNYLTHPRSEIGKTHMKEIIVECVSEYLRVNNQPPSDVLIIKNGSTKYDNRTVVQAEVAEIKEVLKSVHRQHDIRLLYLLLDKDTNQKFFAEKGRDMANPQSGLLVNSQAVGQGFEFYLVAQQCNRGTVRPTFYRCVFSDSALEEGVVEELLFGQCFNYMNWTGSIKVPSVIQYAKKLSMFAGQYIGENCVGERMARSLYYI